MSCVPLGKPLPFLALTTNEPTGSPALEFIFAKDLTHWISGLWHWKLQVRAGQDAGDVGVIVTDWAQASQHWAPVQGPPHGAS